LERRFKLAERGLAWVVITFCDPRNVEGLTGEAMKAIQDASCITAALDGREHWLERIQNPTLKRQLGAAND
jgi:hypothetical protein